MRRLLLRLVTAAPGGPGTPPGRHQDRSARSSLDWDRPQRLTAAKPRRRKRGPGDGNRRDGAPAGASPLRKRTRRRKAAIQNEALTGAPSPSGYPKGEERSRRTPRHKEQGP